MKTVSVLRIGLYDLDLDKHETFEGIVRPIRPDNAKMTWTPQTLGDQVWISYEFPNEAERLIWEEGLPERVRGFLAPELAEKELSDYEKNLIMAVNRQKGS